MKDGAMLHRVQTLLAAGLLLVLLLAVPAWAADAPAAAASAPAAAASASDASLDTRVQDVKGDVIRLNRDLLVLEEELLFPASTQVAVFAASNPSVLANGQTLVAISFQAILSQANCCIEYQP